MNRAVHHGRPRRPPPPRRCPSWVRAGCAAVAAVSLTWAAVAVGQQPEPAAGRTAARRAGVGELAPEIFYLEDDGGQLVPVPGFRYRDFVELFRMKEGLPGPAQPPAAVLEKFVVTGDFGSRAGDACPVTVVCTVRQSRGGWVGVPLRLGGLVLSEPPQHEGPGRLLVDVENGRRGYVAWFDAPAENGGDLRHTVTLQGRMAVEAGSAAEAITIDVPPATSSSIELRGGRPDPDVSVQPPPLDIQIAPAEAAAASVVRLAGCVGPTRIRIAARAADRDRAVVPQATTESVVRIDGRVAITTTLLKLSNLAAGTNTIRLSLPQRTSVRAIKAPATLIGRGGSDEKPSVDIGLERDATGAALIELESERPLLAKADARFEAIGYVVESIAAWRQSGVVSIVVEGERRAEWSESGGVRRIDPPAAARQPGFVAAFAFDSQPASLPLLVTDRPSRVVAEPEYRYDVGRTRIGFQARVRVVATGGPVARLVLETDPTWVVGEVQPAGLVDQAAVTAAGGKITIPFASGLAGEQVVEITGSREIGADETALAWKMPAIRAEVQGPPNELVAPATVVVSSDSDIEIIPDNEANRGLVRQSGAAARGNDRGGLVYRLDAAGASFTATRRFLPRRVDAFVSTQVDIDTAEMAVEEAIRLDVFHVPLEFVDLLVPEAVSQTGSLELWSGDALLEPFPVEETVDEADPAAEGFRRYRAILPDPLLGSGELTARYRLPAAAVPQESTVRSDLPLLLPVASRVARQTLVVNAVETLAVDVLDEAWRRELSAAPAAAPVWSATKRRAAVTLTLATRQRAVSTGVTIDAAWLQTRLLPDRREDVYTYAVTGAADRLTLLLPGDGGPAALELQVDGASIPVSVRPDRRIAVDLPRDGGRSRWLLEVRRTEPRLHAWGDVGVLLGMPGPIALAPPRFEEGITQRRFYWEIDTAPDEYVLGTPLRWTSQQRWQTVGVGLDRVPVVSRRMLAAWVRGAALAEERTGFTPGIDPLVAAAAELPRLERRAVYSGVGPPGDAAAWVVPTWVLVLCGSAVSLAVGLAMVYRPAWRRPSLILGGAAVATLAAAIFPDLAPLVAQAAIPGVLLAAAAWGLRALVEERETLTSTEVRRGGFSGSSLTRAIPTDPSLIVATSSVHPTGSVTATAAQSRSER
jgi:hypothetical protein